MARIVRQGDGTWQFYGEDNSVERYRKGGLPLQINNHHGIGLTFLYGGLNGTQVQKVIHTSGREVVFTWTGDELTSIKAPDNAIYRYTYSHQKIYTGRHLLASTEQPGVVPVKITYHYEGPGFFRFVGKSINDVRYSWFTYDSERRATSTEHAGGAERVTLSYQSGYQNGKPTLTVTETNPLGRVATHNFVGGKLVSVQGHASANCLGSVSTITYDANGYRDVVTGPEGEKTDYDYNPKGQLLKKTEAVGEAYARVTTYTWDTQANRTLSRTIDGVGVNAGKTKYRVSYTYNSRNYVASETVTNLSTLVPASQGQSRTTSYGYSYHANGMPRVITVDGPLTGTGDSKTLTYNASGNLLTVATASGVMATYANHDAMGRPRRVTGPNGAVEEFTYDAAGRMLTSRRSVNGSWHTTTYGYDGLGRLYTVKTPDGQTATTRYDAAWRPVSVHYPEPGGTYVRNRMQYNAMSLPVKTEIERLAFAPVAPVNGSQYVSQVIPSPLYTDRNVTFTVRMKNTGSSAWSTADGYRLVSQSPQFSQDFGVHAVGVPGVVQPGQSVDIPIVARTPATVSNYAFQWKMTGQGQSFGQASPLTTLSLLHAPQPPGPEEPCSPHMPDCQIHVVPEDPYSASGSMAGTLSGPLGVGYRAFTDYDELGRIMARRGNNGQRVDFGYDRSDRLVLTVDADSNETRYHYDKLGRLVRQVDAKLGATVFIYDVAGRITSVTDPTHNVTTYLYDGFGQLWSQSSPDTGTTTFVYSASGLRTSMQRANGSGLSYEYDTQGRVTAINAPGERRTFTYDSCTNGRGMLCSASRIQGSSTLSKAVLTYTPQGQVASRLDTGSGANDATGYAYDGMGRLTWVEYPSGLAVNYVYSGGYLSSIQADLANGSTQGIADEFAYDVTGAVAGWRYANGIVHRRDRDLDGRITGISSVYGASVHQSLTYGHNARELITAITDGVDASMSHQFGYDELGRLTSNSMGGSSTWQDQFDAVGNRLQRLSTSGGVPGTPTVYTIAGQSSRMLAMSGNANRNFQYNAQGNLEATTGWLGNRSYGYDGFDRLTSSTASGVATSYVVNALDQRMRKSGPLGTFRYVYSGQNTLLAQHESNGWKSFVYLGGQPIAMVSASSARYFIHTDHLNRPQLATNTSRQAVWKASNLAYSRAVVLSSIGTGIPLGFPGQVWDEETQTWHNGFRDYDPYTGRYIQSDPIGLSGGLNTYAYVRGNPISLIDPLGLLPGDCYSTEDKAGAAAIAEVNSMSVRRGREFGGWVYSLPGGGFTYTVPRMGISDSVDPGERPASAVGWYHTHGAYTPANGSGNFNWGRGDYSWHYNNADGLVGYLGTPAFEIKKYEQNMFSQWRISILEEPRSNMGTCGCGNEP
ncbi:RHS repeat domain-containing protein [Luteimonas terricola]|uniref:DUF4329 domain-containing protein n=1 Tax=Luteimonas terricola TaxID=645597 RepID=A0ABQ2EC25_9GAMM|nr:RHS repeat-associated core domain-containing protein [Luteimonas terricola]GGK04756.1 hypothetical protein GCM10011394_12320 [Luteimonas terricola]